MTDAMPIPGHIDPVPVPRPRPYLSPREAFLYLLMFATLYLSAWHLGSLVFDQTWSVETTQSVIAVVTFEGTRYLGYELIPRRKLRQVIGVPELRFHGCDRLGAHPGAQPLNRA